MLESFDKNVTEKVFVQMASSGLEKGHRFDKKGITSHPDLRFYDKGKKSTLTAEVMIPLPTEWINWVEKKGGLDVFNREVEALVDKVRDANEKGSDPGLSDEEQNLLNMITIFAYRIPNQGLNSSDVYVVKRFLPAEAGLLIVVPSEMVAKSGSDFDIDKLYTEKPNFKMIKGEPVYIPYYESLEGVNDDLAFALYKDRIFEEIPFEVVKRFEENKFGGSISDQKDIISITGKNISEMKKVRNEEQEIGDFLYKDYAIAKAALKGYNKTNPNYDKDSAFLLFRRRSPKSL
jgi:hypothetical protein